MIEQKRRNQFKHFLYGNWKQYNVFFQFQDQTIRLTSSCTMDSIQQKREKLWHASPEMPFLEHHDFPLS